MRVMIIVKSDDRTEAGVQPSTELLTAMGDYNEQLVKAGVLLAGEGLAPSAQGARVVRTTEETTVTDGPFAESKELVAGFWLLQVGTWDEAVEWAKRVPADHDAPTVLEVRRVLTAEDFAETATPEILEREGRLRAETAAQHGG